MNFSRFRFFRRVPALFVLVAGWHFLTSAEARAADASTRLVGVAKVDVTPDFPIRLGGYLGRNVEATNAAQRIFTKALAIGSDAEGPAILLTVDNCILPWKLHVEIERRLAEAAGLKPERIAICASHSHTAPCLTGAAPNLFGMDIPPADQAHIDRYTAELMENMVRAARSALQDRRPALLSWGQHHAPFAANRRTAGGPVDQDLPFLVVNTPDGHLRALLANYACHCTTLERTFTQVCGDWAGYAQEYLEAENPGAVVLMAIGCGADANPSPRGDLDLAKRHGREIADAVATGLKFALSPLTGKLECRGTQLTLPLDTPPTRENWEALARTNNSIGYHAQKNLDRLDRGEKLETELPYLVRAWTFGKDLAMVFLAGEVVVDYSLRLKREFDPGRLWVNAYANDVPGYIPSERILKEGGYEGGYEGGGAMIYYDHPTRFAPGLEAKIIGAVHELVPKEFVVHPGEVEAPPSRSPAESLATLRTRAGFQVELVASEPLIESPVAIDFGPDGKLWVVEMRDYPMGMDGKWKPGGRIKYLESTKGDGHYDKATIYADNIPFPTGVMAWREGALICTAPDILMAEGYNADGSAKTIRKVFSGFFTENFQARVNGLSYGLDNWVYGANGLLGGVIHGLAGGKEVDIRGRDFRMHPDTAEFEPVSGLTQQGRVRDDWGNWFGCDNSNPLWQYPLPDHYVRRNPFVIAPNPRVSIALGPEPTRLHPLSRLLERFNDPGSANHVTSGCGLGLYRDDLAGPEYALNAFVCEPVHNLVHRLQLRDTDELGITRAGLRAVGEEEAEFLASRDNWFRPVQVRTGPDGGLYVVDMYRFVIEHPKWIAAERLARLDARAGATQGRIYRVRPTAQPLRAVPNLRRLSGPELAAALDTPNGVLRDSIQLELVQRGDSAAVAPLQKLATSSSLPGVRLQALATLQGLQALNAAHLVTALGDPDAQVRRQAIRLSEPFLGKSPEVAGAVLQRVEDRAVAFQLALSLGEWADSQAGLALGRIAVAGLSNLWIRAAVLSSASRHSPEILSAVLALRPETEGRLALVDQLVATAANQDDPQTVGHALAAVLPKPGDPVADWHLTVLNSLLGALDGKHLTFTEFSTRMDAPTREILSRIGPLMDTARKLALDQEAKEKTRVAAIKLVGRDALHQEDDWQLLGALLKPENPQPIQKAALDNLKRKTGPRVPELLLADWDRQSPALRAPILEVLLSREEFVPVVLKAVERGSVGVNELTPANRQRLLQSTDPAIQKLAVAVFKPGAPSSRAEVLQKYQAATTLVGDASRGHLQFEKNCATCHFLRGQGFNVGPNLALLAGKPPGDLLLAILDPNAVVEPRFVSYNIETSDGRSLTGIVSAETATTLTLTQAGGVQETLLRGNVSAIKATGLSLMPEGLELVLQPQDLADLIAYLKAGPVEFGAASREKSAAALARFLLDRPTGLAKVVSSAESLPYPSWVGRFPLHVCRELDGQSKVVWQSQAVPRELPAGGFQSFRVPAGMGFWSQPPGKFAFKVNGKFALDFEVVLTDQTWQSAKGDVRLLYSVMENNSEDSNGVLTIEVANSLLKPGEPVTFQATGGNAQSQRWFGVYVLGAAGATQTK